MDITDLEQLRDITSHEDIITLHWWTIFSWTVWIEIFIALLLIGIGLYFLLKKKIDTSDLDNKIAPFSQAELKLQKLSNSTLSLSKIAVEISLIFRQALQQETGEKALFETHEEMSLRKDSLNTIPLDHREEVRRYLQKLAHLKYSPTEKSGSSHDLVNEGKTLIANIAQSIQQEFKDSHIN